MMLSKRFINNVLRNEEMNRRILSIVIDEAHVVSHWGSDFRKKYGTLGILRTLLPKGTPFVAMSATLGPCVRRDVLHKLQFDENNYLSLNLGNDRSNVSLVVRAIQNPMNTYTDLDFLIPNGVKNPSDVKKAFVYADSVSVGVDIEDRLYERSPASFRETGVIRPYSAAYSSMYRKNAMALFKAGIIRILICTDAAGMVTFTTLV
jgi:superfamily II DNA helicase RecQ